MTNERHCLHLSNRRVFLFVCFVFITVLAVVFLLWLKGFLQISHWGRWLGIFEKELDRFWSNGKCHCPISPHIETLCWWKGLWWLLYLALVTWIHQINILLFSFIGFEAHGGRISVTYFSIWFFSASKVYHIFPSDTFILRPNSTCFPLTLISWTQYRSSPKCHSASIGWGQILEYFQWFESYDTNKHIYAGASHEKLIFSSYC